MLVASPAVDDIAYVSRQEAYRQFKELFADHPEMVAQVSEDAMTDSFLVVLNAPDRFGELNRALCPNQKRCRPGIDQVADESVLTKNLLVGTYWPPRADVSVLLAMEVTDAQRRAVEARIRAIPMVASVTYESDPQAFARLPADLRASKDAPVPDSLPSSLRVALKDPGQAKQFVLALCSSERTGDCAEGVAVVYKHPRTR
jgi:cell division protein FtsX